MVEGMLSKLAAEVQAGSTSAVSLVERALSRLDQNRDLNTVVELRTAEALSDARLIDARVAAGERVGALAGVPALVKDNQDVAGLPTRQGSLLLADAPPAVRDGVSPHRLRAAGAILIGKSNVPEFCIEGFTDNEVSGATRNPWDRRMSPGGSSGGSAAALAAGLVPLATATDGGGSARIPAALCGLLGFKPTNGVIGRRGAPEWIDFTTDGIMTTTVDDARLLVKVLAGPIAGDPNALPSPLPPARAPARLIVAERTDALGPLPHIVATAFAAAVDQLAALLGLPVERRAPTNFFTGGSPDHDWFVLATAEHAALIGRATIETRNDQLGFSAREFFAEGLNVSIEEYLAARRRRFDYIEQLDNLLGADALLVTPSLAVTGFLADGRADEAGSIRSLPADTYSTAIQNMTGLPAVSLPAAPLPDGMPFGLQLTGPRWSDHMLLSIAARWEEAFPWPETAPEYERFA